ncbi:MAG TPA: metallophosphoesterase [Gemmatimonadales bacterium]
MIVDQLVVVADAHLGATPVADEEAFLAFLDAVPSLGDSLLLLGDIYDFWFTYRRLIPRHCIRVTARIVELARRLPILMVGGNHDRWGDTFWGWETGVTFNPRSLRFAVAGRTVVAVHGDGLHEERPVAAMLNRALDTRLVIAAFNAMPTVMGFRIAKRLGHNPAFAAAHPEIVEEAATRQLGWAKRRLSRDPEIDLLLMGHTHRCATLEVAPGRLYVNPGPWLDERRYAVVTASDICLQTFG